MLAALVAGCGDDRATADCNQPRNAKRQVEACTSVIADNPKSAQAYNNRCQAYNQLEDTAKALNDCNVAIKLQPNSASAYNNRGWAYEIRREYDRALEDYSKAIQIDPRFALAYANRGDVYFKKDDKQRATTEYRLALEIDSSERRGPERPEAPGRTALPPPPRCHPGISRPANSGLGGGAERARFWLWIRLSTPEAGMTGRMITRLLLPRHAAGVGAVADAGQPAGIDR